MALTRIRLQALFGLMPLLLTGCAPKRVRPVFHADAIRSITYDYRHCKLLEPPTPTADFLCDHVGFRVSNIDYKRK